MASISRSRAFCLGILCLAGLFASGCASPYRSDRGAVMGGLGGAGVGAIVGNAVGNTGAGALIGAGVGALSGAAVGGALDDIEAQNRAEIAAHLGRPVPPGAVTIDDVIQMTRAQVPEQIIVTHVQTHGMAAPLGAGDLIVLQQQGVSPNVVQVMQAPPPTAYAQPGMIIQERYVAPGPVVVAPYGYYYRPVPRTAVHWGVAVGR